MRRHRMKLARSWMFSESAFLWQAIATFLASLASKRKGDLSMSKCVPAGAAIALWLIAAVASAQSVVIDSGALEGVAHDGVTAYKGVPFAAAPVGQLRWREPQPAPGWTGTRSATAFAPACMQTGVSMPGETAPVTSEDCLYLNVWTPAAASRARLPVLVWIHGGAWKNGSASMPLYWGDRLAQRGVIVVTVAYRLGPLGFLAHPELTAESARASSGNYGLLDQIAALQWVRRNIGAFGGDAKRVTIAGQSSGAMSVSMLMASPQAKGLFQRAIGQSGGLFEPLQIAPSYLLANAERDGKAYATSVGADSIAALRALPAQELLKGRAGSVSHPVIEPHALPIAPYDALNSGSYNDVPLLIGYNSEEARALSNVDKVTAATYAADLKRSFGALPPTIVDAYTYTSDDEARRARLELERDLRFGWDMWAWAQLQSRSGRGPVYFYYFDQQPPFPSDSVHANWGASHFAELWYMFDHLQQQTWEWSEEDRSLSAAMAVYWTNFVKTGDPNARRLPRWPRFDDRRRVLYLKSPIVVRALPNESRLRAFDATYETLRGSPLK
jgi:para-nitrobenzyl esterase